MLLAKKFLLVFCSNIKNESCHFVFCYKEYEKELSMKVSCVNFIGNSALKSNQRPQFNQSSVSNSQPTFGMKKFPTFKSLFDRPIERGCLHVVIKDENMPPTLVTKESIKTLKSLLQSMLNNKNVNAASAGYGKSIDIVPKANGGDGKFNLVIGDAIIPVSDLGDAVKFKDIGEIYANTLADVIRKIRGNKADFSTLNYV